MAEQAVLQTGNDRILMRQFSRYAWMSALTVATGNICAIVDGIVVAKLLDSTAIAIQNVGRSVDLFAAAMSFLLAGGGALLYANLIGGKKTEEASKSFTVSMTAALVFGLVITAAGSLFLRQIVNMLCPGMVLGEERLMRYFGAMLLLFPIQVIVESIMKFFPIAGDPKECTFLSAATCILNLVFDVIFIRVFGMDVEGAVYGTITAYVLQFAAAAVMLRSGRVGLRFCKVRLKDFAMLGRIMKAGLCNTSNQFALSIRNTVCASTAVLLGGASAAVTMSVCNQVYIVFCIVLETFVDMVPAMLAMLRGQNDSKGIRKLETMSYLIISGIAVLLSVVTEAFPDKIGMLFNINDADTMNTLVLGLRIFTLHIAVRFLYILFATYVNAYGKAWYATAINLADSVIVFIGVKTVMTGAFGLNGLWLTFPVNSVLILLCVLTINLILLKKRNSPYNDIMLTEKEDPNLIVLRQTFGQDSVSIDEASENIRSFCVEHGVPNPAAIFSELAAEEMGVYTKAHSKEGEIMDVIVRLDDRHLSLDFKSIGKPFNPLAVTDADEPQNVKLLNSVADKIEYSYAFGINSTRVTVARNA